MTTRHRIDVPARAWRQAEDQTEAYLDKNPEAVVETWIGGKLLGYSSRGAPPKPPAKARTTSTPPEPVALEPSDD